MIGLVDFLAVAAALAAVGLILAYTLITGSPPAPSSRRLRAAMLGLLPGEIEGTILELGAGWGNLAFALARRYPAARVVGYERSPLPWLASRLWLAARPLPNLKLKRADYRAAPLDTAALATCYLLRRNMAALAPRFAATLRPGAMVLSATFAVPGWRPVATVTASDMHKSKVYLYRLPESLDGDAP